MKQIARIGNGTIQQVAWSPDGNILALAGSTGIWLYDANNLDTLPRVLGSDQNYIDAISFSADNHSLLAVTDNGSA